jgi:hypothetical protein
MRGHHAAAQALGGAVDVLWWTDHDWRIAGHSAVDGFDFESGLTEVERAPAPLSAAQWDGREPMPAWASGGDALPDEGLEAVEKGWRRVRVAGRPFRALFEISEREARSGRQSLHISLEGEGAQWEASALQLETSRRRHVASLASGVKLRLSVLPALLDGDARLILRAQLSQQPPDEQVAIDYVIRRAAPGGGEPPAARIVQQAGAEGERGARRALIDVPAEPGVWNDLVFDLSADAIAHQLGGIDNSLVEILLIAQARGRGRLDLYVDTFAIEREQLGPALFAEEKRLASSLEQDGIVHHVGQEISYAAHLNAYGAEVPLADSRTHPHGYTPAQAVALAHRHGGVVSLNHLFGVGTRMISHRFPRTRAAFDATVTRLIEDRAYGVDLLEVGYRSRGHGLDGFVELWDRLASAGIRLTGVGVSDSHDNDVGWARGPNNFITWVLARSAAQADLLNGLRAGRAFFGDPTRFDGRLDIEVEGQASMGKVLERPPGRVAVKLLVEGLRPGQSVQLLKNGQRVRSWTPKVDGALRHELDLTVEVGEGDFARFEIHDESGPIAFSNPVYFVRPGGGADIPAARRP